MDRALSVIALIRHVEIMIRHACVLGSLVAVALLASERAAAQNVQETYRRGCEGGEVASCTLLGLIYETGAGGQRDLPRAMELYGRACDFGIEVGCTRLALAQATPPPPPDEDGFVRYGQVADSETGAPIPQAV